MMNFSLQQKKKPIKPELHFGVYGFLFYNIGFIFNLVFCAGTSLPQSQSRKAPFPLPEATN